MMSERLSWLSLICHRYPRIALGLCTLFFVLGATVGQTSLKLQMDWTFLFYPEDEIVVSGQAFRQSFPLPGDVAVLVDGGTGPQERRIYLDRLAERLKAEPETFHHILHRIDLKSLVPKALYYLDDSQLRSLLAALAAISSDEVIHPNTTLDGPGRQILLKLLEDLHHALTSRGQATYVPLWEAIAPEQAEGPVSYLRLLVEGERYIYPTIGNDIGLIAAKAGTFDQEFANAGPMVVRLREIIEELSPTAGQLRVRLTGLPVMLHDERETVAEDGARSTVISLVLIAMVFALGFGEIKRPFLTVLSLTYGMAWTVGFATLAIGHLNFISVTLTTMLMGIGIDFGIHFIFRYDEEMSRGFSPENAIRRTMEGTGIDTFVGAMATAGAFLALTQAHFRGISDFGIIAAAGTLLCFLSTVTVLPALLSLFPGSPRGKAGTSREVTWLEGKLLRHCGLVVAVWVMMTILAISYAQDVGFNYNLLEVQAQEVETVRTEIEMVQERNTVLSAEVMAADIAQARRQYQSLKALPSVSRVSSLVPLLPEVSATKQALVEQIVLELKSVKLPEKVRLETADDLVTLGQKTHNLKLENHDHEIAQKVATVRADLKDMKPGPIQDSLIAFQDHVRHDLTGTLDILRLQEAKPPVLEDMPEELKLRYLSRDGSLRQNVQPVKNIWQRENLEEFLTQIQVVETKVMGHPVIQDAVLTAFHRTLARTPWFTLFGVLLVFTVYLRQPKAVMLSLLPASLAVAMIFATLGFLRMDFNVVSFVGLPISVGLGAVYGVHSLHRMRELGDERVLTTSTGPALLLSGVTDLVGFASLMTAQHRGISSLGLVISVGIGTSFLASLILLPALRRWVRQRHKGVLSPS